MYRWNKKLELKGHIFLFRKFYLIINIGSYLQKIKVQYKFFCKKKLTQLPL
jgi:hypothetical protein